MKAFHLTKTTIFKTSLGRAPLAALSVVLWGNIITACQTLDDNSNAPRTATAEAVKSAAQEQNFEGDSLSPRQLSPGECGLFIWAGEARRFILFAQNGQSAVLAKDGQELLLTPKTPNISGDFYNQIPIQNFSDGQGVDYSLSLAAEQVIDGGIRYASGTWRYKDSSGWDVIKPVYGLSTCQAPK